MSDKNATGKKMQTFDLEHAFAIWVNPFISVEDSREKGDSVYYEIFNQKEETPETIFFKKERFYSLGEEAREIIKIIFGGPSEMLELISSPQFHVISKTSIKRYLHKYKKLNSFQVNNCLKELIEFTRSL